MLRPISTLYSVDYILPMALAMTMAMAVAVAMAVAMALAVAVAMAVAMAMAMTMTVDVRGHLSTYMRHIWPYMSIHGQKWSIYPWGALPRPYLDRYMTVYDTIMSPTHPK